ncbi:TIGR03621 family F420-dependent LLM class oxidoreductase [Kutzneria kofuensis]|uniref:Putative F420-dependent oxidoreductase n=1 Tax=Kutzneria kofuensis TaxID=103725 RepID=A0A7W9KCY5_9PSEU|nr:TIGR03621 family F420-dependent LLM class oxidoreductase [Kutzneria kofuensis]MBB5890251.1 putative F420-dependent oxidoreductase [Kutzneria kofuensis]
MTFRFGFTVRGVLPGDDFVATVRRAESYGYDVALVPDHLGPAPDDRTGPSPFPTMVAAALATERLRVGSFVLNAAFWNPGLLAREIVTADQLTGGRLEVGIGAGWARWEFDDVGVAWRPFGARVELLARTITEVRDFLFGDNGFVPAQRDGFGKSGPPLLIGGTGRRVLRLAAEHVDIISHGGLYQVPNSPPGTFRLHDADGLVERLAFVRQHAGARFPEIEGNLHVHYVEVTPNRRAAAERFVAERMPQLTVPQVLDSSFLLLGTEKQLAEQIRAGRERFGLNYVTVSHHCMDAFGPVIEALR